MDLPQNSFKRALKAGKTQIGLWSSLASNYSVEVIAGAGYDWLLLDCEHAPNDLESLLAQLQACAPYPSAPVVRVPWNDTVNMKRVLDIGAQSLLIPYVCGAEEARAAVAATRYPPAGVRGVAGTTRATRFGRVKDYAKRAHEEICVLVQVRPSRRWTSSRRSARWTASMACSSGRPTCMPRWAIRAKRRIRRSCR